MAEEITRAELNWLENHLQRRAKQLRYLTKEDALVLRLVDSYRREKGWEEDDRG